MSDAPIDMTGQRVANWLVVEYAATDARRAYWWLLCLRCHGQKRARGTNIRKAQRSKAYRIECKGCGE